MVPPEELLEDCRGGKVVLFAGSGVAASAGLPTGQMLLLRMLEELNHDDPSQQMGDLRSQIGSVEPSLIAEVLQLRLGAVQVRRLLERSLLVQSDPARQPLFQVGSLLPEPSRLTGTRRLIAHLPIESRLS